jgi:hypothetical protein
VATQSGHPEFANDSPPLNPREIVGRILNPMMLYKTPC